MSVRLCELLNELIDWVFDLSGSLALYALPPRGIMGMGPSASYVSSESFVRRPVQHCGTAGSAPSRTEVVPGSNPAHNDPECTGRWPKTPGRLGCRPAGTSLLSLGRTLLRVDHPRPGITQQVCPARCDRTCWVTVVHPCREVIYLNSRVHGNRTLRVVS